MHYLLLMVVIWSRFTWIYIHRTGATAILNLQNWIRNVIVCIIQLYFGEFEVKVFSTDYLWRLQHYSTFANSAKMNLFVLTESFLSSACVNATDLKINNSNNTPNNCFKKRNPCFVSTWFLVIILLSGLTFQPTIENCQEADFKTTDNQHENHTPGYYINSERHHKTLRTLNLRKNEKLTSFLYGVDFISCWFWLFLTFFLFINFGDCRTWVYKNEDWLEN